MTKKAIQLWAGKTMDEQTTNKTSSKEKYGWLLLLVISE